ncbi:MAG: endonuclease/exonuclease/phosphatase family protein [Planctomycetes bacterium]|nr:endonuclease/exonuclease/phosphatase family protein [Planctomycetota bacterium]
MKLLHALSSPLLAVALAAQSPTTLTLGTWNLEFLGSPGNYRQDLPLRDDADFAAIGARIRELGVDVLAVQEINDEASLLKVAAGAGPTWQSLLGTTGGWDDGVTAQRIGFLWNSDVVELLGAEELLGLPREKNGVPIFHRVPVTAWFRVKATGFDFRAITVHLKAGQKDKDDEKRRLEATELHRWLSQLRTGATEDQDYVVLGDFNSSYGTGPEQLLEQGDVVRYVDQPQPAPTIQHFAEPIDQIAPGPGFAELRRGSYRVHAEHGGLDKAAWRKTYSDHYAVTVQIDAAVDADPNATFRRGGAEWSLPATRRPTPPPVAEPKPAPAAPRAVGKAQQWPPAVGSAIQVRIMDGTHYTGRLHQPLPEGPTGWLVLETEGALRAVPFGQIAWINLQ